jgi:CrcB protein
MTRTLALIALGGALGAVARYAAVKLCAAWWGTAWPWGTFAVNVAGSFAIGVLYVVMSARTPAAADAWRAFLVIGFLGALTTFSAFSLETLTLLEHGHAVRAVLYVMASVSVCLLACGGGIALARG